MSCRFAPVANGEPVPMYEEAIVINFKPKGDMYVSGASFTKRFCESECEHRKSLKSGTWCIQSYLKKHIRVTTN